MLRPALIKSNKSYETIQSSNLINSFVGACRFLTRRLAPPLRRVPTWPTLAIALLGATGFARPVSAQDCQLTVQAAPNVLKFGQTANVDVRAHFPASAYAFASSEFDVLSTDPMWSFASAGAIVGPDVLGINVGQAPAPQIGVVADPSNPIRVWTANFTPVSDAPALVGIEVDPASFWYYPTQQTSSSVPCDAKGGEDWIFVNPLYFGEYGAAPGRGTSLEVSPEGFVASTKEEAIQIGLFVPTVPEAQPHVKAFAAVRLQTDGPPDTLTVKANPPAGEGKTVKIDFLKTDAGKIDDSITPTPGYEVYADFPLGAEIQVHFYRDAVSVHDISITKHSFVLFRVERVPDLIAAPFEVMPSSGQRSMVRSVVVAFDAQFRGGVSVAASDVDGSVRFIADRAVVTYTGLESQTTLKKVGVGTLILNVGGIQTMAVSPLFR